MQIVPYEHKAQYYETDKMGIIHHSNYIRWFEEARIDFMEQAGIPYHSLEEDGLMVPVLEVECQYKNMTRFGETVCIETRPIAYNGIRMRIGYTITEKESGQIRCTGETAHCFLDREGRPVFLKKGCPRWHERFLKMLNENE
jgi:acyl-CoA thioester hydrolase